MTDCGSQGKNGLNKIFDCVNFGIEWSVKQVGFPCPPRKRRKEPEPEVQPEEKPKIEPDIENSCPPSTCPNEPRYIRPDQICPYTKEPSCCVIKMQNPCAPCCCEKRNSSIPCPPKCYPTRPREPTCGCDYCKKPFASEKCCGENERFWSIGKKSDSFHTV